MVVSWVDDYYVICNNDNFYNQFFRKMSKEFDVKDLGTPKQVLQAVIEQGKNSISVSQERAITDALKKFGMENCNPASTVLPTSAYKLTKGSGLPPAQYPYLSLLGTLL